MASLAVYPRDGGRLMLGSTRCMRCRLTCPPHPIPLGWAAIAGSEQARNDALQLLVVPLPNLVRLRRLTIFFIFVSVTLGSGQHIAR
jgi:hypothetical protein